MYNVYMAGRRLVKTTKEGFYMKLCAKFFLFVLLVTLITVPSFAIEPKVRQASLELQAASFDTLLKQTVVTLDTAAAITADDIVSTGTEAVYMLPDSFEYPIKLRIQNHGSASLTYVPYVTSDASGITLPTATSSHLMSLQGEAVVSGKIFEGVFFQKPDISIGASGNQEVIIEVWGRKNTE